MEYIEIVMIRPGRKAERMKIPNELSTMQSMVEGYIEVISSHLNRNICYVVNEDGKLRNLPYNKTVEGHQLFGNILVIGIRNNDFTSLTEDEIRRSVALS